MFFAQLIIPALLVFTVFITGHLFVDATGSGIYLPETDWDGSIEEVVEMGGEEIDPTRIDPETGGLLPDKYNYLKVENIFTGKIIGSEKLFSLEIALLTKQPSIASDLFISALLEMEPKVISEVTNVLLDVNIENLETLDGRMVLTTKIKDHINQWLEDDQDMFPGITQVYIINFNIVW